MKRVNSEVLQGILTGESIPKIAKRMEKVTESNKAAAIRTARTCITSAENRGRLDSYRRAEENGTILDKKWISSDQPGRTREWHFSGDFGAIEVAVDKPFSNSLGLIMYPGDPGAHPANVYSCRCSMRAVIKGFRSILKQKQAQAETDKQENNRQTMRYHLAKSKDDLDREDYFTDWESETLTDEEIETVKTCKMCEFFIPDGGLCKLKGKAAGKCLYFEKKEV